MHRLRHEVLCGAQLQALIAAPRNLTTKQLHQAQHGVRHAPQAAICETPQVLQQFASNPIVLGCMSLSKGAYQSAERDIEGLSLPYRVRKRNWRVYFLCQWCLQLIAPPHHLQTSCAMSEHMYESVWCEAKLAHGSPTAKPLKQPLQALTLLV